ncbi:Predicted arabinose efflux permease, MFS family [Winogradskyella sediminis]|uniref:Predicted arabinose efflux permease, MFS family n=1 Tax=Winogradskyella sediminis TaxID=1382466 RepID=A0A1H1V486_9FLAO|nr:Predicted arabinose efflux permease, MFS family [Winogradskyella sediminis]
MKTQAVTSKRVLPLIIFSQFCCTSLWFAGNAVVDNLIVYFNLSVESLGYMSSSVQFGFIIGTFIFAMLSLSDRFSPSRVFFICAVLGSVCNFGILYTNNTIVTLVAFRFFTGFSLAGIYPVGMKIAADYFEKGLGKSLSFLIAALVLGTAFPYLIQSFDFNLKWQSVVWATSVLALLGGVLILIWVPNGPYRKRAAKFDMSKILNVFKNSSFRSAAMGYFGHMWELYAFWTFVPAILMMYQKLQHVTLNIPLWSFLIIASGTLSCIIGGFISEKFGVKKTAGWALSISGFCCLLSPLFFMISSTPLFIIVLVIWGMAVIADSPLFSTMVAQNCEVQSIGTALTIVNCIGYSLTIISIQMLNHFTTNITFAPCAFTVLALGPIIGLIYLKKV